MGRLTVVASLAVFLLCSEMAMAGPLIKLPDLSLGAVAAAGSDPGMGCSLSYPILGNDQMNIYLDAGLLLDSKPYNWFVGISTDKSLPVLNLEGGSWGVGWMEPTDTWTVYVKYPIF